MDGYHDELHRLLLQLRGATLGALAALALPATPAAAQQDLDAAFLEGKGFFSAPRKDEPRQIPKSSAAIAGALLQEAEGPAAALECERSCRGPKNAKAISEIYPECEIVPFTATKNIRELDETLWSKAHVIEDFNKNRTVDQRGIIVLIKTENCCTGHLRMCAVATAALEKRATPLVKKFRLYGAWVERPRISRDEKVKRSDWDKKIMAEYAFDLGPGAQLIFIDPANGHATSALAYDLDLYLEPFEKSGGQVPLLEKRLKEVLDTLAPGS